MRGSPTPEGYDDLAEAVTLAANELLRHPGPLADACAKVTALVTGAQEVLEAYQTAKRKAGLIDYADMIVETETLLRTQPDILSAVLGEIDCVVIDEFQDTNPVQFSLLWTLAQSADRALIVGDTKQSIMGFQGADARLSQALQDTYDHAVAPLDRNWRSDPRIMSFVNALGPVLFTQGYDALTPERKETGVTALEAINLPGGRSDTTAQCIADRITSLPSENTQVYDKVTKVLRPAKATDIAVLCYTGSKCEAVAAALEAHNLPVRLQQSGWLGSQVTLDCIDVLPQQLADLSRPHGALDSEEKSNTHFPLHGRRRCFIKTTSDTNLLDITVRYQPISSWVFLRPLYPNHWVYV